MIFWRCASSAVACSLEKEKQAKGEDSAVQPLLAGTQHRDLDHELGVATDGALARLLDSDGKDLDQEIQEQLAVKYEHGERVGLLGLSNMA